MVLTHRYIKYFFLTFFFFCYSFFEIQAQEIHTPNADYHGFRLHLFNIEITKENKNFVQIQFNIANTGRKDLDISEKNPHPFLTLDFDTSLLVNNLGSYRENIRRVLTTSDIRLPVGGLLYSYEVRFPKLLPEDTIKNPVREPNIIAQKDINKRKDSNDTIEEEPEPVFVSEDGQCFDFELDTIRILSQTDKWLTLEYVLKNKGSIGAPMLGDSSDEKDNLAIRAYISGVPKLSKGAIVIGGTFVENRPKGDDGILPSGKRMKSTFKLDIRKKSKYMNYIIFNLDPFQTVQECDERNNVYVLELQKG